MYKIAYYEENNYHTEIMGTFLEYYSNKGFEITVYNTCDKSLTVDFFKKKCNFKVKPHKQIIEDYPDYNIIIVGSAGSCCDFIDKLPKINLSNIIFICHNPTEIKPSYQHVIVLTPLNYLPSINPNISYILPIHGYITENKNLKKNIFTIIGRFKDANRDYNDLVNLIKKYNQHNFIVHIFSRANKFIPNILLELSRSYPQKLKIFLKFNTEKMDKYIQESKYILPLVSKNSWYHKDRLSGNIAIAFNYQIPLIIDQELKKIYNIEHCITYQNSITEVIDYVTNLSEDEYQNMVSKIIDHKKKIIESNNLIMNSII